MVQLAVYFMFCWPLFMSNCDTVDVFQTRFKEAFSVLKTLGPISDGAFAHKGDTNLRDCFLVTP